MESNNNQLYRFSEAPIWDINRKYYEEEGLRAWNKDQVPQYITCNPMIGTAYAELIFGFLQDIWTKTDNMDPVVIVEIGAGSGRLAFHVLHELCKLIEFADMELPPFKYVMTDLVMNNVLTWKNHPNLQKFILQGLLDFARFDAVNDTELDLVISKEIIKRRNLKQPVVIVANYFFDSIPQELLYIGEGKVFEADVLVKYPSNEEELKPSELLKQLSFSYQYRRAPQYEQPNYPYRDVIAHYQKELEDSHILFPVSGLTCLERLNELSQEGFLLITADKGDHIIDNWKYAEPPELVHHGSFSFTANYHAFEHVYTQRGALGLFPMQHYSNINVGCIINVKNPKHYFQTRLAYRRFIERFGPDEFFSLKEWVDPKLNSMELKQILSFWRLGGYDMEFFLQSSKYISSMLIDANDEEKQDIYQAIEKMYSSYYVIEKRYTVAMEAGLLLFEMDMYEDCKRYLEIWISEEPEDIISTVYYCLAVCCFELELQEEGIDYLRKLITVEPNHEEAIALLNSLS